MSYSGAVGPVGTLGLSVFRNKDNIVWPVRAATGRDIIQHGLPQRGSSAEVNAWRFANRRHLMRGVSKIAIARALHVPHFYGQLWLTLFRADGEVVEYGLASMRVVTTAGVNFIVDAFQNTTELENLKFHGIGTGTNAEAVGDTALQTELTTQYNPDNTRATGSLAEGASANIFRTVGTNTVDAAAAITEHGILSQAATGGGTLLDRSVFSVINLANGDSLQSTYDFTVSSGG